MTRVANVRLALALAAGLAVAPSAHPESVTDWLMRMTTAANDLSYRGTFVYLHENQIETMRVARMAEADNVRERLYSLNGAAREIIRDQEQVWCYLPDQQMGVHQYRQTSDNTFPRILPRDIADLEANYRLEMRRQERIADRMAQEIRISPRDTFRYGYALWVDAETGLLLRADLLDTDGMSIEQYMFTDIEVGADIDEGDLRAVTPEQDLVWIGDRNEAPPPGPARLEWAVGRVPDGFMLTRQIQRLSPMRKQPVEHLVYSDGLAAVSVFIERRAGLKKTPMEGLSRMGALHAFATVIDNYQVTVVGEVPADTVDMMGMSVRRN